MKPIVSERDSCLQECRSDALVMPLVVDRHADIADVGPSWASDRVNSDLAYDSAIDGREQYLSARLLLREELAPCFRRREWNLKRAGDRLGRLKDALNGLEIARLRMPDDDAHPFDLELDRRILHFHFIELNDRLNIRIVRNVAHDGIGVRPECFLKCVHRVENQVSHGNERRL